MSPPVPERRSAGWLAVAWLVAFVVMHLRGDGRFPFPAGWSRETILACILPLTLAFHAAAAAWLWLTVRPRTTGPAPPGPRARVAAGLALIAGCLALQVFQATRFGHVGYALVPAHLVAAGAVALVVVGAVARRPGVSGRALVLAAGVAALALKLVPLADFPVDARRSDLLPILREAGRELVAGRPVYRYYRLENQYDTPNVRLPGLMVAYAPAAVAGVDLRWVTLASEALLVLLLVACTLPAGRPAGWYACLLAAFLLMPYFHTRHELYEPPLWIPVVACVLAMDRGAWRGAGAAIGLAASAHQWGFLLAPQVALLAWRRRSAGAAAAATAVGLVVGALVFLPLVLPEVAGFRHHVIEVYAELLEKQDGIFPYSLYLSPLLAQVGLHPWLLWIQLVVAAAVLWGAARGPTRMSFRCALLAAAILGHLLFNALAWTYQLLLPLLLGLLAVHYLEREEAGPPGPSVPSDDTSG